METGISARLTPAEGRKFAFLVGGAFLVFGLLLWRRAHVIGSAVALVLAGALILAGLIAPGKLGPVHHGWMAIAKAISKVTTPIFMGVIFFVVLTPAGILGRLFGHRPLSRPKGTSYWLDRQPGARRGDMDHQF